MSIDEFIPVDYPSRYTSPLVLDIDGALRQVASLALHAFPIADGVGISILAGDGSIHATVASADFVRDIDAVQFGLSEGPCFSATATGRLIYTGGMRGDTRWPRFGPVAARLGVSSVLALPLALAGIQVGAIDIYSHRKNAVNYRSVAMGRRFCGPAAVYLQRALDAA